ncbi:MAG: cyclic nucleotide-binding domain-containing protein [Myxococcales bacterium]|nr:cyclic nucleotide-binding domain-containing protein [Myxococcales bacterium]
MTTIAELRQRADEALFAERFREALAIYARLIELQPTHLDARLRVADALLSLGELQSAAVVYASLAKHAALAGYPLRSLVAIKVLATLEPKLESLLQAVGALYARDSGKLGRSVRRSLPDPSEVVPADQPQALEDDAELVARAEKLASSYTEGDFIFPEKLMPIPVLSLLNREDFGAVLASLRLLRARPDTPIIEQGDAGSSFFVLTRGRVRVAQRAADGEERVLAQLHEGAIFGEMALLASAPRSASVIAVDDCDLLEFDRDALQTASKTMSGLTQALASFAQQRLLNNVMSNAQLFQPLDDKQRYDLVRRFVAANAQAGDRIIGQDEPGKGLYVVLRGQVEVSRSDGGGEPQVLATLGPGDTFGEISLLNDAPTTASIVATEPTSVLFLGRQYCERLVEAIPEIREYLENMAEGRVMETFRRVSRVPEVPAGEQSSESKDTDVLI